MCISYIFKSGIEFSTFLNFINKTSPYVQKIVPLISNKIRAILYSLPISFVEFMFMEAIFSLIYRLFFQFIKKETKEFPNTYCHCKLQIIQMYALSCFNFNFISKHCIYTLTLRKIANIIKINE